MGRSAQLGIFLLLAALAAPLGGQERARLPLVEWAPDGKVLISGGELLVLFDLDASNEEILDRSGAAFAFSPDGRRLAVAARGQVELRGYPEFAPQDALQLPEPTAVTALAWSPDGNTLAAGTRAGHLLLWEVSTRELWADLGVAPASALTRLSFSADSARLLAAFEDGRAVLWDIVQREEVHRFGLKRNARGELEAETQVVALSPDGRRVLVTETRDAGAEIVLLDDAGRPQWRRAGYGIQFTPEGAALLALAPPFRIAALYRADDAAALRVFEPPTGVTTLYLVRLRPDGKFLLGVGEDPLGQVLIVWDFSTGAVLKTRR